MPHAMPHGIDRPVDRRARPAALRALAGAALVLSLGGVPDSATAQTGNRTAQAQSPAGQTPGAAARQAAPAGDPVEAQLAEVRQQLGITAAQQPQFEKFASVIRQNAQAMDALMQKVLPQARPNAVEGLRIAASFAQTEADNLKRLVPALEALYASLSEQQRRTADQLFSEPSASSPSPQGQPQTRPRG